VKKVILQNGAGIQLYAASMGKIFRVTHVCQTTDEANKAMEQDSSIGMIAEDQQGRIYLAELYGPVCPSAILDNYRRSTQREHAI